MGRVWSLGVIKAFAGINHNKVQSNQRKKKNPPDESKSKYPANEPDFP